MMTNIDITELLEKYVQNLEKNGISRDSIESKVILEASAKIKNLRKTLEFQIKCTDDVRQSRVELLNIINNAMKFYGETCKRIREETAGTYVCNMCKWDCDHEPDECPGFETNDCFELDNAKYMSIIFKASE